MVTGKLATVAKDGTRYDNVSTHQMQQRTKSVVYLFDRVRIYQLSSSHAIRWLLSIQISHNTVAVNASE